MKTLWMRVRLWWQSRRTTAALRKLTATLLETVAPFRESAAAFERFGQEVLEPMRRRYEAMTPEQKAEWDREAWPDGRPDVGWGGRGGGEMTCQNCGHDHQGLAQCPEILSEDERGIVKWCPCRRPLPALDQEGRLVMEGLYPTWWPSCRAVQQASRAHRGET